MIIAGEIPVARDVVDRSDPPLPVARYVADAERSGPEVPFDFGSLPAAQPLTEVETTVVPKAVDFCDCRRAVGGSDFSGKGSVGFDQRLDRSRPLTRTAVSQPFAESEIDPPQLLARAEASGLFASQARRQAFESG